MERQTFIDLLFQSMRDSARQVRLLLGRLSSRATREQAFWQVEMLPGSQGSPNSWEIDELQEQFIEKWAKAARLWVEDSEKILTATFGPMIA